MLQRSIQNTKRHRQRTDTYTVPASSKRAQSRTLFSESSSEKTCVSSDVEEREERDVVSPHDVPGDSLINGPLQAFSCTFEKSDNWPLSCDVLPSYEDGHPFWIGRSPQSGRTGGKRRFQRTRPPMAVGQERGYLG